MCLAAPGKVISINQSIPDLRMAKVDFSGVIKDICIEWLPEAGVGSLEPYNISSCSGF